MAGLRAGIAAAHAVRDGSPSVLRVRHLSSYGPNVLPIVAARLRDTDPLLVLELREASIEEQIEAIQRRAGDVGVFHLDPDVELDPTGITTTELVAAPRFVALPRSHALASSGTVSLGDLSGEAWVMPVGSSEHSIQTQNAVAACRRHGFEPRVGQRANSIETMLGLVASGFGVAPAPWPIALRPPQSVSLVRLVDAPMRVVVARRSGDPASAIDRFVLAATDVVGSLLVDLEHRHPLR